MTATVQIRRWILPTLLALAALGPGASRTLPGARAGLAALEGDAQAPAAIPLKPDSVRFAVIGDSGTGDSYQNDVAQQMVKARAKFPFDFVIMLGDNIYGGHSPQDFSLKFERPYQSLLDAGVKFYASLGNHDDPSERFYTPFNMSGQRYYAYSKGIVRFIVLDSNYMDSQQLDWLEKELHGATSPWKIAYFHHPLYSDGRFHGPDTDVRARVEPLFEKYGVNVVFSGHDHVYERIKPQHGIYYFVLGNAGELRYHNLKASSEMAAGFDEDRCFMAAEVAGDELYFQTISRTGKTVDSGILQRQQKPAMTSAHTTSRRASPPWTLSIHAPQRFGG
jgi:3',5'-cyclic AMP phosphodiesterase CpdA